MDGVTKQLIKEYRVRGLDFLGYRMNREDISYHHIEKRSDGGRRTVNNGSILNGRSSHPYIHLIENKDLEMYRYINSCLKEIHKRGKLLNERELLGIYCLLERFEREYCSARSRKGELLIKEEFIKGRVLTKKNSLYIIK